MSIAKIYKATLPSVNYIFKNGKPAIFIQGKYATAVVAEIAELDDEIALGHPHIFVDPNEAEIDSNALSPIEALTAQIRAQLVAEMQAATDPSNDMGTSTQGALKPASTSDIAAAAVGGSGEGLSARLMNLGK